MHSLHLFIVALTVAFLTSLALIRRSVAKPSRSLDFDLDGPQKMHRTAVPRVGGVAIYVAALTGAVLTWALSHSAGQFLTLALMCAFPAFAAGLLEDLTKKVTPRQRLLATAVSALLGALLLDAVLVRTAIPGVDTLIQFSGVAAVLLTVFIVTGVANSVNIIDGFNGLASMCSVFMLMAIAYVAFQVNDTFVFAGALLGIGAVLGFFAWNFPGGRIFLGDGGAYFLGYYVATLAILLIRNDQVSPLFALLVCAYPITETLFSIYRRKVLQGRAADQPDALHLHTLFYKRVTRCSDLQASERRQVLSNSMTSTYLWVVCGASVIPAVIWWNDTGVLALGIGLFVAFYTWLYWSIVCFRTPTIVRAALRRTR